MAILADVAAERDLAQTEIAKIDNQSIVAGTSPGAQAAAQLPRTELKPEAADKSKTDAVDVDSKVQVEDNVLFKYATYTYGLTLFMLSVEEYEKLQKDVDVSKPKSWSPKYALISSAGRYNTTGVTPSRQAEFLDNFYFENFKMTTVIGSNSQTRGTNAIEISFTIVEPYGMTLLDRLINASKSPEIGSKNYLAQPYLLELDFFGADDLGDINTPIDGLTKRFPVQLIEFKIKASTKGAEYAVKAVPFSHGALRDSAVTTPINLEVEASTVGNFFDGKDGNDIAGQDNSKNEARDVEQSRRDALTDTSGTDYENSIVRRAVNQAGKAQKDMTTPYKAKNYNKALNEWFALLKDNKDAAEEDKVEFVFSGFEAVGVDIKASSINPPETPNRHAPLNGMSGKDSPRDNLAPLNVGDGRTFGIHAGSRIIDIINQVMQSSDYISRQLVDDDGKRKVFADEKWVDFYKIIPQIKELRYDTKRKRYATTTAYHIVYHRYFNAKHPLLPYANPTAAVKEYNYMYTGKNRDILDFTIDFDVAYFTATVGLPGNAKAGNNNEANDNKESVEFVQVLDDTDTSNEPNAMPYEVTTGDSRDGSKVATKKQAIVANAMSSIYSNSRGDMINVKLKIVGDPAFIKQDDLYTNPGMKGYNSKAVHANGSIATDHSEIFCIIRFKTPTDVKESDGLSNVLDNEQYSNSRFSGFYKILTVDSEFSRGQFVQTINCVRMMKSVKVKVGSSAAERQENVTDTGTSSANSKSPGSRPANINPVTGAGFGTDPLKNAAASASNSVMTNSAIPGVGDYKGVVSQAALGSLSNNTLLPKLPPTPEVTPIQEAAKQGESIKRTLTGGR